MGVVNVAWYDRNSAHSQSWCINSSYSRAIIFQTWHPCDLEKGIIFFSFSISWEGKRVSLKEMRESWPNIFRLISKHGFLTWETWSDIIRNPYKIIRFDGKRLSYQINPIYPVLSFPKHREIIENLRFSASLLNYVHKYRGRCHDATNGLV